MTSPTAIPAKPSRAGTASSLGSFSSLYALTLRQHLHGRRWMVIGAVFLLPAALALLIRWTAPDVPPMVLEFLLAMMFIPQLLLPLVALLYASGMIQDEQEEQTLTYLLIRPLPKWALYLGKLSAALTTTVALTIVFTGLTYAAIYAGAEAPPEGILSRFFKAAAIHSVGVTAYCCLFGLLSLVTKRTLVVGIVYSVVVEGFLANLPFGIRLLTVIYYTRLIAYRTIGFVVPMPHGGVENLSAAAWQLNLQDDPNLLEHPQISTCILVLAASSLSAAMIAAWLCTRREFHVKTPEKG